MAEVQITNDGKEKWSSWEARLELDDYFGNGHYSVGLYGYGIDEKGAREELNRKLSELKDKLANIKV